MPPPPSKAAIRFSPRAFTHNARVAAASVPALAVILGYGGNTVASVSLFGAVSVYFMDYFRQREGALAAIWATLAAVDLCLVSSHSGVDAGGRPLLLCVMSFLCCTAVLFHTGCWATLQFRWVQMQSPAVVLAMERLVISGSVTLCGPLIALGGVATVGVASTPFYMAAILSLLYWLLSSPLPSCFLVCGETPAEERRNVQRSPSHFAAQGGVESACATLTTLLIPPMMYLGVHRQLLHEMDHVWSVALLTSGPLLAVLTAPSGLWWLPLHARAANTLRWTASLICLGVFITSVQGRVVFSLFRAYIAIQPPWDWLITTVAVYGHCAVVVMHFSGVLQSPYVNSATLAGLILACVGACVTVGVPLTIIPAPVVSALGLGLYYRSRSLREYALFLLGCGITGLWFMYHHFSFLDISWELIWNVQRVCALLVLYTAPTLLLPGVLLSEAPTTVIGVFLVVHSGILCLVEAALLSGNTQLGIIYPGYAVIYTSVIGCLVSSKLLAARRVPVWSAHVSRVTFACKLVMLLLRNPLHGFHLVLLSGLSVAPVVLHPVKPGGFRRQHPSPSLFVVYALATVACCWGVRDIMVESLSVVFGDKPKDALALGCFLIFIAASLTPLIWAHHRRYPAWKIANAVLAFFGVTLTVLQPPMPFATTCNPNGSRAGHARKACLDIFTDAQIQGIQMDDTSVYASSDGSGSGWTNWLLVLALLAGLGAAVQYRNVHRRGLARHFVLALITGCALGGYISVELFPRQSTIHVLLVLTCVLLSSSLVFISTPVGRAPQVLPAALFLWAALLPVAFFIEHEPTQDYPHRLHPDVAFTVDNEQRMLRYASLLAVYAAQSALLAFCVHLKLTRSQSLGAAGVGSDAGVLQVPSTPSLAGASRLSSFLGGCLPPSTACIDTYTRVKSKSTGSAAAVISPQGLEWLPTVGNFVTLLCFGLCLALDVLWFGGNEIIILPLSSVLLMLHADPILLPALFPRRRYVPPLAAAMIYLFVTSLSSCLGLVHIDGVTLQRSLITTPVVQVACVLMALPSHVMFLCHLWERTKIGMMTILLFVPVNLVSIVLSSYSSTTFLASLGVLESVVQCLMTNRNRRDRKSVV